MKVKTDMKAGGGRHDGGSFLDVDLEIDIDLEVSLGGLFVRRRQEEVLSRI